MPHLLTAIAEHENIFIVIFSTHLTWCFNLFLFGELEEHGGVKIGDLLSVFNDI